MKRIVYTSYYLQIGLFCLAALGLALTPLGGIFYVPFVQLFMGVVQVLAALIDVVTFQRQHPTYQAQLKRYGLLIAAYAALNLLAGFLNEIAGILILVTVPWAIAIYFFTITRKRVAYFKKHHERGFLAALDAEMFYQ